MVSAYRRIKLELRVSETIGKGAGEGSCRCGDGGEQDRGRGPGGIGDRMMIAFRVVCVSSAHLDYLETVHVTTLRDEGKICYYYSTQIDITM
jgi:hypothetical protein